MEHIEYAGVHSGDSACVIPPITIPEEHIKTINEYTKKIARELNVIGLMNIQYAIADGKVYVLEANPRASRTVPLVSKICNISMAKIATEIIMDKVTNSNKEIVANLKEVKVPYYGVKEAVFPFNMFPEIDPLLGPEMKSTGEVLGMGDSFGFAFYKAQEGTQVSLPTQGSVLITVREEDREAILEAAQKFAQVGFEIKATEGTSKFLAENGIQSTVVKKLHEGRPNILDIITNKDVNLVINTPLESKDSNEDDSYIRKAAIRYKIPYITTTAAAIASAKGIESYIENSKGNKQIKNLQEYHQSIQF